MTTSNRSDETVPEYFRRIGRIGGKKGGPARAAALTPERRKEIATAAINARWARKKEK